MSELTEDAIEQNLIVLLKNQGYNYAHGANLERKGMNAKFEVVHQMFHGFDYGRYFDAPTGEKLLVLLAVQNFILKEEKLKERFLSRVTSLSKLYVMAVLSDESEVIKERIAFFQAIKARINKFTPSGGKTDFQVDTTIR